MELINRAEILREVRSQHRAIEEQRSTARTALISTSTYTLYASRPRLYDVSDYQPIVDWSSIASKDPQFAGGYIKLFEPYDDSTIGSINCNYWFEETFDTHLSNMPKGKLKGVYFFNNPRRFEGDLTWYQNLDNGTPQEQMTKWMEHDPHIYGLVRGLKIGWRNKPTSNIEDLKKMTNKEYDFIVQDVERYWRNYLSGSAIADPSNVMPAVWIGEVAGRTQARMQKLVDWGILRKVPLLMYSAMWFINQYMKGFESVFDQWETIPAGYFWNASPTVVTTADKIGDYLKQIPDSWRPKLFGKNARILQISGDHFKIPEMRTTLGPTALDLNVYWGGWSEMETFFSRKIDQGTTIEPTPDPIPDPTQDPVPDPAPQKRFVTVNQSVLNVRSDPSVTNPYKFQIKKGEVAEVLEEVSDAKGNKWGKVSITGYIALKYNGIDYVTENI